MTQRAVGFKRFGGPPSAGGINKGQGAVGFARVGDEAP
jgi:hypothetical protein